MPWKASSAMEERLRCLPPRRTAFPNSFISPRSDVIIGVVRARSVHEVGYGHKWDWEA